MKFKNALLQLLCPFGQWPHEKGLQIVDRDAAGRLAANFKSSGIFGTGIKCPIFIGHPDDGPRKFKRRPKPVGAVEGLAEAEGGIVVLCSYEDKTYADIIDGKIKRMSPRWRMEDIGDGKFRPEKLLSVGLTNNPNIPDSGRIVNVDADVRGKSLSAILKRISCAAAKAQKCSDKMVKIVHNAPVLQRTEISTRKSAAIVPPCKPDLTSMAKERMRQTGLPYTSCFAAVRRETL